MSDIAITNSTSNISQHNTNPTNTLSASKAQATSSKPNSVSEPKEAHAADTTNLESSKKDIISEEFGDVVSVSEDGDTVRVKNEQNQEGIHDLLQEELAELEDNKSFDMPDFDVHKIEIEKPELDTSVNSSAASEVSADITSYIGYSDSELKQLYLKGDISQIDYNQEMEAREARREAESMDMSKFTNSVADNISKLADISRTADTVNTIENGDTSNTIPDNVRLQALQNLQNFDTV